MAQRKALDSRATGAMVLLSAVWGLQQVAVKIAAPDMAPVLQIAIRSTAAALAIGLLVAIRREGGAMRPDTWMPGLSVGTLFGLEFLLVSEGLRFTSASHMSIFLYTAPIFAAFGLHLRLPEERLTPTQWIGAGVAFTGIAVSLLGGGPSETRGGGWIGDVLGLAAGAAYGATTVSVRTSRLSDAPATVTLLYQLAGAAAILSAAALLSGQTGATPSPSLAVSLAFQTVVVSIASFLAWFALLRTYLASRLGVLSFMTPLFGIAFGVLILDEPLDPAFVAGAGLVIAGIVLVGARDFAGPRGRRSRSKRAPAGPAIADEPRLSRS